MELSEFYGLSGLNNDYLANMCFNPHNINNNYLSFVVRPSGMFSIPLYKDLGYLVETEAGNTYNLGYLDSRSLGLRDTLLNNISFGGTSIYSMDSSVNVQDSTITIHNKEKENIRNTWELNIQDRDLKVTNNINNTATNQNIVLDNELIINAKQELATLQDKLHQVVADISQINLTSSQAVISSGYGLIINSGGIVASPGVPIETGDSSNEDFISLYTPLLNILNNIVGSLKNITTYINSHTHTAPTGGTTAPNSPFSLSNYYGNSYTQDTVKMKSGE